MINSNWNVPALDGGFWEAFIIVMAGWLTLSDLAHTAHGDVSTTSLIAKALIGSGIPQQDQSNRLWVGDRFTYSREREL